jgi:hypothetical protein
VRGKRLRRVVRNGERTRNGRLESQDKAANQQADQAASQTQTAAKPQDTTVQLQALLRLRKQLLLLLLLLHTHRRKLLQAFNFLSTSPQLLSSPLLSKQYLEPGTSFLSTLCMVSLILRIQYGNHSLHNVLLSSTSIW